MTTKVWPAKASAVNLKHPQGPILGDGALWPEDSFTARRLVDGSVTNEEAKAFKAPAVSPSAETPDPKATKTA